MEFDRQSIQVDKHFLRQLYFPSEASDVPDFAAGIEEEYFVVNADTKSLSVEPPDDLFDQSHKATQRRSTREFLTCQIEVSTPPCATVSEAGREIRHFRKVLCAIGAEHGKSIIASGTHPTGEWEDALQSDSPRYGRIRSDLGIIGRRNLVCGMHVHVQLPDPSRRIEIMRKLIPYVPLFIALSASSPFWRGFTTGLKSYRYAAYDELPRTGIPELFVSESEYQAYIQALQSAGAIPDSSYVWWAVRPSHTYPTLELRAPDCCTNVQHTARIASLYQSLVRNLFREPADEVDTLDRALAVQNKWSAQRFGVDARLAFRNGSKTVPDFLTEVLENVREDAAALGCDRELLGCLEIAAAGSSADKQLEIYHTSATSQPIRDVLEWLHATTVA